MAIQVPQKLKEHFNTAKTFAREEPVQASAIIGGILMGSTALATPVLGTALGAGLALALGLGLLMKTSDTVVNNASALGKKAGISAMALGIGLGVLTSMPELFVSAGAMLAGNPGIGVGNIVGSNIANLLLILGGTAVIKKINSKGMSWKFNCMAMGGATALFGAQMVAGAMSPVLGAAMLGGLGLYLWQSYKIAQKDARDEKLESPMVEEVKEVHAEDKLPVKGNIALGLAGVAGLVGSAAFVVASATAFGTALGVSQVVIGVLAVAVGTSLPEVMVNIKSALKGHTDMAVGNILGSNVFNLLMIGGLLSLTGAAMPADLSPRETMLGFVNTLAFGASAFLTWAAMKKSGGELNRKHGWIGLGLYGLYTAATVALGSAPGPEAAPAVTPAPAVSAPTP